MITTLDTPVMAAADNPGPRSTADGADSGLFGELLSGEEQLASVDTPVPPGEVPVRGGGNSLPPAGNELPVQFTARLSEVVSEGAMPPPVAEILQVLRGAASTVDTDAESPSAPADGLAASLEVDGLAESALTAPADDARARETREAAAAHVPEKPASVSGAAALVDGSEVLPASYLPRSPAEVLRSGPGPAEVAEALKEQPAPAARPANTVVASLAQSAAPRDERAMQNLELEMPVVVKPEGSPGATEPAVGPERSLSRPPATGLNQVGGGTFGMILNELDTPLGPRAVQTATISSPLGGPAWGGEFAGRVSVFVKNGFQEASLQLNPPELGRLDIKIFTEGDQAKMLFAAQSPAAREAIEQAMPRLREMLEHSGIQLAHSEVSDQSQSQRGEGDAPQILPGDAVTRGDEATESPAREVRIAVPDSAVDYYV